MSPSRNESDKCRTSKWSKRLYVLDGVKPLSLNEAYATMQGKFKSNEQLVGQTPKKKGWWKNKVWRRKTAEAAHYQWLIQETLAFEDETKWGPKLLIPTAEKFHGIALSMVFFIPPRELRVLDGSKFKGRDVSNYVKLIEDAVFEYLGRTDGKTFPQEKAKIQDSSSIEPLSFKRLSWDNDWHIGIFLGYVQATSPVIYHAGDLVDLACCQGQYSLGACGGSHLLAESGDPTMSPDALRQFVGLRSLPEDSERRAHV